MVYVYYMRERTVVLPAATLRPNSAGNMNWRWRCDPCQAPGRALPAQSCGSSRQLSGRQLPSLCAVQCIQLSFHLICGGAGGAAGQPAAATAERQAAAAAGGVAAAVGRRMRMRAIEPD